MLTSWNVGHSERADVRRVCVVCRTRVRHDDGDVDDVKTVCLCMCVLQHEHVDTGRRTLLLRCDGPLIGLCRVGQWFMYETTVPCL
jgi:hypothetical protein